MVDITLVFPYFNDGRSRAFKFPPLGIGYIASYLRQNGYSAEIVDCTFLDWETALRRAEADSPRIIGVYSMLSMVDPALRFANELRDRCDLLVAGGPMPSAYPEKFLGTFDVVAVGEAEDTMLETVQALEAGRGLAQVKGLYLSKSVKDRLSPTVTVPLAGNPGYFTGGRPLAKDLDRYPFPCRDLYDMDAYRDYYRKSYGYTMTSMVASRGCPFACDFCWRPDYGRVYRVRSPGSIVDEMEEIKNRFGFDRIWFADELFIANKKHVLKVCSEILDRRLDVKWECLTRADLFDEEVAAAMKNAGCDKVIFGLEAGDDRTLKLMNKHITVSQSKRAVSLAYRQRIKVGAFFILGYPGETNDTMLNTIRLASTLPLEYFSMTIPYPLPGTPLYERVKDKMLTEEWEKPTNNYDHKLLFKHDFTTEKLKYGMHKAVTQAKWRKRLGPLYALIKPWEWYTDSKFKQMN